MPRSISVAALQLRARDRGDFPSSLESVLDGVRSAAGTADLVVLPEGTLPAYVLGREPLDYRPIQDAVERLGRIARETQSVVVAGVAATREGSQRNAAIVLDADGSPAGHAEKIFLWHFDRFWFEGGDRIEPIETRAGRIGVLVCADGRLPTLSRALVDGGAQALVMPTAWVTSGRDPSALENVQADLLARVRAYENRVPFVAANKCGSERGMVAYCGKSQIIDANGEIVAIAGEREPETITGNVTLAFQPADRAYRQSPPPAECHARGPVRIAISYETLPGDTGERLELLEDAYAVAPGDDAYFASLRTQLGAERVTDAVVLDPGGLVSSRHAGYRLICWNSELQSPWLERIARARALELRLYVVVFARAQRRAFAVDPDGAVVAGTFDDFRIASFAFDPRRTQETSVAPGTDIESGLERVERILQSQRLER